MIFSVLVPGGVWAAWEGRSVGTVSVTCGTREEGAEGPLHSHINAHLGSTRQGSCGEQGTAPVPHLHSDTMGILKQSSHCQECLHAITELQHSVLKGLIKH